MCVVSGFKAALKHTVSNQREDSVSGPGCYNKRISTVSQHSYNKRISTMSQHSYSKWISTVSQYSLPIDDSIFGLSNHLSRFSTEITTAPFPALHTFPGGEEAAASDNEGEEEVVKEVCVCVFV